ncbi:hypothetical protein SDC9_178291 [bioreactor metagenome]|uniref:Uncharacterized protein n=1 Tax=bioreactor metagenome TaxID=1076179 RepID=A0A645GWT6_9ZZZZ
MVKGFEVTGVFAAQFNDLFQLGLEEFEIVFFAGFLPGAFGHGCYAGKFGHFFGGNFGLFLKIVGGA